MMIAIKTPNFYAAMKLTLQAKFTYRTGTNLTYKSLYTSELKSALVRDYDSLVDFLLEVSIIR